MARIPPDKVQKELDRQEDEVYGDELSSAPNPDKVGKNTKEDLEAVIGKGDVDIGKPFSLADQIEKDDKTRKGLGDDGDDSSEVEEDEEDL